MLRHSVANLLQLRVQTLPSTLRHYRVCPTRLTKSTIFHSTVFLGQAGVQSRTLAPTLFHRAGWFLFLLVTMNRTFVPAYDLFGFAFREYLSLADPDHPGS